MRTTVTHDEAAHRYELRDDDHDGALIGFAAYRVHGDVWDFTHNEIGDAYGSQGMGTTLIEAALRDVAARNVSVLPHCSFVQHHIARHSAVFLALVPHDRRAEFGLPAG